MKATSFSSLLADCPRVLRRFLARHALVAAVLVSFALLGSPANAREKNDLEINLVSQRVTRDAAGIESLVSNASVAPGDTVQYTATYRNRGAQALHQLAPTLPIPAGMQYVPGEATPAPSQASLDGKNFEPVPLRRIQKLANGTELMVEVPPASYRALRWDAGDLPAGATATFVARARLAPASSAGR